MDMDLSPEEDAADAEEMTYGEILSNLVISGELLITIPVEEEAKVRTGLKNLKAKQAIKMKDDGLPVAEETLEFSSVKNKEYEDCVDLHVVLKRKGAVRVLKMVVPDNSL